MPALAFQCTARTDVGGRVNNEDAVFGSGRLVAVADGVGGAAAGEIASRAVIMALAHLDKSRIGDPLEVELNAAIRRGNDSLAFLASCRPELVGMATTLTTVALTNDGAYLVANIGDSRTYLLRDGVLRQLTRDASLVQALIDGGTITPAEARVHPQRSVVLEALDGRARSEFPVSSEPAVAGDRLLLCSDGLSDVVEAEAIAEALGHESRAAAARRLVDLALAAGGRDNVSVLVADVVPRADPDGGWLSIPAG